MARIHQGRDQVLNSGCADVWASRTARQSASNSIVTDLDPVFTDDLRGRLDPDWPLNVLRHDIVMRLTGKKLVRLIPLTL